ncbi:DNA polymerase delta, subunit 4-domain-containing protein [Mycena belliarum]|uniref:DNA polymerase delta, subunit 4-domain-containing protein n=1 Tax=Mycena belliarum TaxID=1033014 RepID=A0AAD6XVX0_9AGAR|nr:DNA polymerase delta, subunit 4-domain-containing protein [Mycena belliae]
MPKSSYRSKSAASSSLKQGTLLFSASKRTASSSSSSQKLGKRSATLSSQPIAPVDSDSDEIEVDDIEISSVDDDDDEVDIIEPAEPAAKESPRPKVAVSRPSIVQATRPKASQLNELELDAKDAKWKQYLKAARAKRGAKGKLIHAEEQDEFHEALRVFDLSYEYGPCIGVSRLERWERASALGLHPPSEVHDILTTRQGADRSYAQPVFYEDV